MICFPDVFYILEPVPLFTVHGDFRTSDRVREGRGYGNTCTSRVDLKFLNPDGQGERTDPSDPRRVMSLESEPD